MPGSDPELYQCGNGQVHERLVGVLEIQVEWLDLAMIICKLTHVKLKWHR